MEDGFQVRVQFPGRGIKALSNWIGLPPVQMLKVALHQKDSIEFMLRKTLRLDAPLAAPILCKKCKSEHVWHKSLEGSWSRICNECGHTQNLNAAKNAKK
jgi:hypothetical protein